MNLKKLEEVVNGEGLQESFHLIEIHGVCIDSKNMKEGNLFVPIIRMKDGHEYVKEAMDNGAVASLWKSLTVLRQKGFQLYLWMTLCLLCNNWHNFIEER